MEKQGISLQISLDGRLVAIAALLLILLAAGVWRANASSNTQLQSGGMDANTSSSGVLQGGSQNANQGPADINQAGDNLPPTGGDANGGDSPEGAAPDALDGLTAITGSTGGRLFYLTNNSVAATQPKTSCAAGYHMASLWEIYDTSNLTYNFSHPQAYNKADSGSGPPSRWYGWIRTGYDSSNANLAGTGNCSNWTSTVNTNFGTILRLNSDWLTSTGAIGPWEPDPYACSGIAPVWCIED